MSREFIPLLSGKSIFGFTPAEYKQYIKSLHYRRPPKKSRVKKKPLKLSVRRLKSGRLSVTTKRNPKYITEMEYDLLKKLHPENELFIALKEKGVTLQENHP